jgi:hypothetical protein
LLQSIFGADLDREEAIKLFKEIIAECKINIASVSLVHSRKDNALSDGFQLHIKSILNGYDRELIQRIMDKHQLAWKQIDNTVVIYKPQITETV